MFDYKTLLQSRTIWSALVGLIATLLLKSGYNLSSIVGSAVQISSRLKKHAAFSSPASGCNGLRFQDAPWPTGNSFANFLLGGTQPDLQYGEDA